MIYLKTILIIAVAYVFFLSGLITVYEDIQYQYLWLIVAPIVFVGFVYVLFRLQYQKALNFSLASFKLNFGLAAVLLFASVVIRALNFDFSSLVSSNYANIRSDFIEKQAMHEVSLSEQLVPLLTVYPFIYLVYELACRPGFTLKSLILIVGLLFIEQTTGGRQIAFQIFILVVFIKGRDLIRKKSSVIFIASFVLLGAIVTLGRYDNPDVNKAQLLENITPMRINDGLKDSKNFQQVNDVLIEAAFYFGQTVPAFCNDVANLDMTLLPEYPMGIQPFLERQFYKIGLIRVSQEERYEAFVNLKEGSGFFETSWTTGFLDIYFNLGMLGSLFFFFAAGFLLYNTQANLDLGTSHKYRILQAYNVLFIITMFMTPVFMDTTIIFSYLTILACQFRYA